MCILIDEAPGQARGFPTFNGPSGRSLQATRLRDPVLARARDGSSPEIFTRTGVEPWFNHGLIMVWPWFDHGLTMVKPWSNHGQTMIKPWLNHGSTPVLVKISGELPSLARARTGSRSRVACSDLPLGPLKVGKPRAWPGASSINIHISQYMYITFCMYTSYHVSHIYVWYKSPMCSSPDAFQPTL